MTESARTPSTPPRTVESFRYTFDSGASVELRVEGAGRDPMEPARVARRAALAAVMAVAGELSEDELALAALWRHALGETVRDGELSRAMARGEAAEGRRRTRGVRRGEDEG